MNNKISISLLVAIIATSVCFSLNFFSTTFEFNGWDFFLTYAILTIVFSIPMSKIAAYTDRVAPLTRVHSDIIKKYSNTSKLKSFSLLITGVLLILMSITFFNASTYILDIFDTVPRLDRLSAPELIFNNQNYMYAILATVAIITVSISYFATINKINIDKIIESIVLLTISTVIILVIVIAYKTEYLTGFMSFFDNSIDFSFSKMFGMAVIYAILSNFISISVFKNIIKIKKDKMKNTNINTMAFYNAILTVIISFIICVTLYSLIDTHLPQIDNAIYLKSTMIFKVLAVKAPTSYFLTEIAYLMFNLLTLLVALGYLVTISKQFKIRLFALAIPFGLCFALIKGNYFFVDFCELKILHLVIIYTFLFVIFFIGWLYDAQRFSYEMLKNTNTKVSGFFNISIRLLIPARCVFGAVGDSCPTLALGYIMLSTLALMVIYIAKGVFFKKMFGKRRY